MISFNNDYNNGCHEDILKEIIKTNNEITDVYGNDFYSLEAKRKIKEIFDIKNGDVFFLAGGTQTNEIIISTLLKDYEGVISADSGHINVHEAMAVEYTGHKVITIKNKLGKIDSQLLKEYLINFYNDDTNTHMVKPGMLYVSFPTEYGTLYSKQELVDLYNICKEYNMKFYIDGARLLYGLYSSECDIKTNELKDLCDCFYIGGTKEGLLIGEALVFTHDVPEMFTTRIKMHGAMLSKGRLIGVSFNRLFSDDLYKDIAIHTNKMASELKDVFKNKGYKFYIDSPTNQQFIVMDNKKINELKSRFEFSYWEKGINQSVVRFVTSWSTEENDIKELEKYL